MNLKTHTVGSIEIIEVISKDILIKTPQDALDLLGELQTQYLILHDYNFEKDFFDLSTRKLGEILEKFTNYQIKLAIIGDFSKYPSKVLGDYIRESNEQGDYLFVPSLKEILDTWNH